MTYLQQRDVGRLEDLFHALRDAAAPWLAEIRILGPRAALATPLEHARFALFAVPCEDCAPETPSGALFTHVGTYDAAIYCPRCGEIAAHPLGVRIGAPHPVGRCAGAGTCRAHLNQALDASGLCITGRTTLARAQREAEKIGHGVTPRDRALLDALKRAREVAPPPFVATVAAMREACNLVQNADLGTMLDFGLDLVFGKPNVMGTAASHRHHPRPRKGIPR